MEFYGMRGILGLNGMFVLIQLVFFVVIALFVYQAVKGLQKYLQNEASPVQTEKAFVVAKRMEVHHHHSGTETAHFHTNTTYYITFQREDGTRIEMKVKGKVYGMTAEQDEGKLTWQGTRFHSFERSGFRHEE